MGPDGIRAFGRGAQLAKRGHQALALGGVEFGQEVGYRALVGQADLLPGRRHAPGCIDADQPLILWVGPLLHQALGGKLINDHRDAALGESRGPGQPADGLRGT